MLPEEKQEIGDETIGEGNAICLLGKRTRGILPKKFASYNLQSLERGDTSWQCEVCKLQLSSKESLRRHVLARHIKQPVHRCHLCTSSFVLKFQLLQHLRMSHPSSPDDNSHPCICGRVFSRRNSLLCHIKRVHHPAPMDRPTCSMCGKTFNDKAVLRAHHTQVHALASIPCPHPGCDKVFRTLGLRNAHYRYHEQRQYCCNICDKPFSTRSYRDKHQLTHSGVREYVCVLCGVACITASQLGTHTKRRHGTHHPLKREEDHDAHVDQTVNDILPVEVLLGSADEDTHFIDQSSNETNSVHTFPRNDSVLTDHNTLTDHSVPSDHNTLTDDNTSTDHNTLTDHNTFTDHKIPTDYGTSIDNNTSTDHKTPTDHSTPTDYNSLHENPSLPLNSPDSNPHSETNASFHDSFILHSPINQASLSERNLLSSNFLCEYNDGNYFDHFLFDDAVLDDYKLSV